MGVLLSIKRNLQRFIQMTASKHYSSQTNDSNVHNELSICDECNHPASAFSHHVFRSVILMEFRDRLNKWDFLHSNLPSEEGPTLGNDNAMLSPLHGKLKVTLNNN